MSRQSNPEEVTMQYLLGSLSEEERAHLEEGYFSSDEKFEELEIAEDELIDRYVRGELSETDKVRFEATLAGSLRVMERVKFARLWRDRLTTAQLEQANIVSPVEKHDTDRQPANWWSRLFGVSTESRSPRVALAFSVLLVLLGGVALLTGWLRLREESRRLEAQRAALEQQQLELQAQAADLKSQADKLANQLVSQPSPSVDPSPPKQIESSPNRNRSFLVLTLSPGNTRGGGGDTVLRISPETREVQLTLDLRDSGYSAYQASIRTVEGKPIFSSERLTLKRARSGDVLILQFPAKHLSAGQFIVHLEGLTETGSRESVDDYVFTVTQVK